MQPIGTVGGVMTSETLGRGSRSCVDEVRRLRAAGDAGRAQLADVTAELDRVRGERDHLARLIADYAAADSTRAQIELWQIYARESYQAGRADMATELAGTWPFYPPLPELGTPTRAELEQRRWSVRGERRTRETFSQPHQGDWVPPQTRAEAAK